MPDGAEPSTVTSPAPPIRSTPSEYTPIAPAAEAVPVTVMSPPLLSIALLP